MDTVQSMEKPPEVFSIASLRCVLLELGEGKKILAVGEAALNKYIDKLLAHEYCHRPRARTLRAPLLDVCIHTCSSTCDHLACININLRPADSVESEHMEVSREASRYPPWMRE